MQKLQQLTSGKSVALVGNSERILRERPGKRIDAADVVIRINRGLPQFFDPKIIGERTTVHATARFWPDIKVQADTELVLWMKLTRLGIQEAPQCRSAVDATSNASFEVWPQALEDAVREYVGADPGTGIRLLWWLKKVSEARHVSCYGMDCWEEPTHWSGNFCTQNHVPSLEREAMLKLL